MAFAQYALEVLRNISVIERVVDVVTGASAAVGQGDIEVDLQGLRHDFFALVDAD